jgi:cyclic pyranopterin phosphate synthase
MDRLCQWQQDRLIVPLYLEISPVAYCNHRCIFCAYDFARKNSLQLDTEIICKRLREMGELGVKSILYSGEGEPLLHKDLPLLISTAKESGIDVALATNGSLGSRSIWQKVLPYLSWVRFSLDAGTPAVYASVHGVAADTFQKTINGIKSAVETKRREKLAVTIGVQFLVLEENLKDLPNAIALVSDLGADYLSIKPYSFHPFMKAKKDVPYARHWESDIEKAIKESKRGRKTEIIFRKDALQKYMQKEKNFSCCRAMPFWGHISARGDFFTCGVFIGDDRFKAGSIYRQDMRGILFGDKRRRIIAYGEKKLDAEGTCRKNCRMSRVNEFLQFLEEKPAHLNFI